MDTRMLRLPILLLKDFVPFVRSSINVTNPKLKANVLFAALEVTSGVSNKIGVVVKRVKSKSGSSFRGLYRAELLDIEDEEGQMYGYVNELYLEAEDQAALEPLFHAFMMSIRDVIKLSTDSLSHIDTFLQKPHQYESVFDIIVSHLDFISLPEKQSIIECNLLSGRLQIATSAIEKHIELLRAAQNIRSSVKSQINNQQTHAFLREQMKAIQKALEEYEESPGQLTGLQAKIKSADFATDVRLKIDEEFSRLQSMSPMSSEAAIIRNYIDHILSIPWNKFYQEDRSIAQAAEIIEKDHYGLQDIKQRIKEYIAVSNRIKTGQILCLIGPPGVGKTSLARSLANALGRKFATIQLGGLKDASEIYGHRRTYIGAMPGKLVQTLQKVGSMNCVILLDEIDKMGNEWRGDPASALLSVLDPEQNQQFKDHYLEEVSIDLSKIIFIATANSEDGIPQPLLDRMEVINVPSYTHSEKCQIATKYLIPRVLEDHGCKESEISFAGNIVDVIVSQYTQEAGIRKLKRVMEKLVRKAVYNVEAFGEGINVSMDNLQKFLGPAKYIDSYESFKSNKVGTVTGLAWTQYGGTTLPVQSILIKPGKGEIIMTGKLGQVMQESARAALSLVKSNMQILNIPAGSFDGADLHFHAPEGAISKDGPSAGVALATAFASRMSNREVKGNIAMTGEIDLDGNVLAVGGIKEKLLAAHRCSIKTVFIPIKNKPDLHDVPEEILSTLDIIPVSTIHEVWKLALIDKITIEHDLAI